MRLIDADKLISDLNNPDLCNVTPKLLEIVNEQPTITRECRVCGRQETTFCEKCENRKDDKNAKM